MVVMVTLISFRSDARKDTTLAMQKLLVQFAQQAKSVLTMTLILLQDQCLAIHQQDSTQTKEPQARESVQMEHIAKRTELIFHALQVTSATMPMVTDIPNQSNVMPVKSAWDQVLLKSKIANLVVTL